MFNAFHVCNHQKEFLLALSTLAGQCNVHTEQDKLLLDFQWREVGGPISAISGRKQIRL